jgi:2-methylisocitrate lyase-like PEP mutase family enzyme
VPSDFLALHQPGSPLLLPNAWDPGSARILAELGFAAVATTSSGFAATLGRPDGAVTRDEALAHAAALVAAVDVPVSADLENGYADSPDGVARTVAGAREVGLAGCSVEDHTGYADDPVYDRGLAAERVAGAAEAAGDVVLTARCENYLHGRPDLADTLARLQAYQEAGADVLYAPGLRDLDDIATVCREVDRPVNALLVAGGPTPAELAEAGVARISVGGAFAWNALSGLVAAARELLGGEVGFLDRVGPAREVMPSAFDV